MGPCSVVPCVLVMRLWLLAVTSTVVNCSRKKFSGGGEAGLVLSEQASNASDFYRDMRINEGRIADWDEEKTVGSLGATADFLLNLKDASSGKDIAMAFAGFAIAMIGVANPVLGVVVSFIFGLFSGNAIGDLKAEIMREVDLKIDKAIDSFRKEANLNNSMAVLVDYAREVARTEKNDSSRFKEYIDKGFEKKVDVFYPCYDSSEECWKNGDWGGDEGGTLLLARISFVESIFSQNLAYRAASGNKSLLLERYKSWDMQRMVKQVRYNYFGFLRGFYTHFPLPDFEYGKKNYLRWKDPLYKYHCREGSFYGYTSQRRRNRLQKTGFETGKTCRILELRKRRPKNWKQFGHPTYQLWRMYFNHAVWQNYWDRYVNDGRQCSVSLYADPNFKGHGPELEEKGMEIWRNVPPGEYDSRWRDYYGFQNTKKTSSVQVGKGCKLVAYRENFFSGGKEEFGPGNYAYIGKNMNDKMASFKILVDFPME